jgi:peptidoglycan glycosyltransferase
MLPFSARVLVACTTAAALAWCALSLVRADAPAESPAHAERAATPRANISSVDALAALAHAQRTAAGWVAVDAEGRHIELSLVPQLQERARRIFNDYQVPYAAVVAIEPSTGRLLAYVSHSSANPGAPDLARDPTPPAASVFKLITASALLDAGVTTETSACYGGGASRLEMVDLLDDKRRDRNCATLADALGGSINAVFAKLADRHLDATSLRRFAAGYGFGEKLPGGLPVPVSPIEIPGQRLEFARTAAGFWHSYMSPLHAALIAATIANDGNMPWLNPISRVLGPDGHVLPQPRPPAPRNVVSSSTARAVGRMMLRTVTDGTSRTAFRDARGRPLLPGIAVAGKTGSLNANNPFRAYSWWVGFAPADKPQIALASLIVNTPTWRIKSSFVARELLHEYLMEMPRKSGQQPMAANADCVAEQSCVPLH